MTFNVAQLLQISSVSQTGAVQVGSGLSITPAGLLSLAGGTSFPGTVINVPSTFPGSIGSPWNSGFANLTAAGCIEISTDNSTFTQGPLPINNGDTLYVRWAAGATCTGAAHGTVITGTLTDGFNTFTANFIVDRIPNAFTLDDLQDVGLSATVTSNPTFLTGLTVPAYVTLGPGATITNVQASIGGGAFVAIPTSGTTLTINPTQSIQLRGTVGPTNNTTYFATIRIGDTTAGVTVDNWDVRTLSVNPTVSQPSITSPVNDATGLNPLSNTPAGIPLVSTTYSSANGAGTHANTDWETYLAGEFSPVSDTITDVVLSPNFPIQYNTSIKFNSLNGTALSRATTSGNRQIWTFSLFFKLPDLSSTNGIFSWGNVDTDYFSVAIEPNGTLHIVDKISGTIACELIADSLIPLDGKWKHLCISCDTTQAIATNRLKIYINGVQITSFSVNTQFALNTFTTVNNATSITIGRSEFPLANPSNLYMAGIIFVDGIAQPPTAFATGFVPIDYIGSFGATGFELLFNAGHFTDTSSAVVGDDTSGNNLNFTVSGTYTPFIYFAPGTAPTNGIRWHLEGLAGINGKNGKNAVCNTFTKFGGKGGYAGGGGYFSGNSTLTSEPNIITFVGKSDQDLIVYNGSTSFFGVVGDGRNGTNGTDGVAYCDLGPVYGRDGRGGDGGASGYPQSTPGYPGSGTAGGNGGGANGNNQGITSNITGTNQVYCRGGNSTTAATGSRQLLFSFNNSTQTGPITFGTISNTTTLINSIRAYYCKADNKNTAYIVTRTLDTPTPSTNTDTGKGAIKNGNYPILNTSAHPVLSERARSSGLGLALLNGAPVSVSATTPIPFVGKYYWEIFLTSGTFSNTFVGVSAADPVTTWNENPGTSNGSYAVNLGSGLTFPGAGPYTSVANRRAIIGIAFDADQGRLYISYDGVWQNSGDPVLSINPAFLNLTGQKFYPVFGGASNTTINVNFGATPFFFSAPTGYTSLIDDPVTTTLTFNSNNSFNLMQVGDRVQEQGGDATGEIISINSLANQIILANTSGTWSTGSTLIDQTQVLTTPPTSDPPNPSIYQQVVNQSADPSNLTSYNIPANSLLPQNTYYSRVRYRSNDAIPIVSQWSAWNGFKTGTY